MDIFIRNIPDQMTENDVNRVLSRYMHRIGITTWKCDKFRSKSCAIVTVLDITKAKRFLHLHGQGQQVPSKKGNVLEPIFHINRMLLCSPSNRPVDPFLVGSLEREEKEKTLKSLVSKQPIFRSEDRHVPRVYDIKRLRCGQWDYRGDDLVFRDYYHTDRAGQISFGPRSLFIKLAPSKQDGAITPESQLQISFRSIESCTTGSQSDPSITFSLREPPKFFEKIDADMVSEPLSSATNSQGSFEIKL